MKKDEIGLRDISINSLENSIRKYFSEKIENFSSESRLINSFQYYFADEVDNILFSVRLKMGNAYTAYEDCDFTKLSISGATKVIEKAVLDITNVEVFARISQVEFKYEEDRNSYIAFHVCITRQKVKLEPLQW